MQNIFIILIYSRLHILVFKSDLRVGKMSVALQQKQERRNRQRREEERTEDWFLL